MTPAKCFCTLECHRDGNIVQFPKLRATWKSGKLGARRNLIDSITWQQWGSINSRASIIKTTKQQLVIPTGA